MLNKHLFHQPYTGQDTGYVIVIARTGAGGKVVVVNKRRPSWQAGRFNFPGGKIEANESPLEAAVREMREETGVVLKLDAMRPVAEMVRRGDMHIFVFATETDAILNAQSLTDEPVSVVDVDTLRAWTPAESLANVPWFYDMAFDGLPKCAYIEYDPF